MATAQLPQQECAVTVLGGPTAVIDMGGLRIVSDPTFDEAGPHGYLVKTTGPARTEDAVSRPVRTAADRAARLLGGPAPVTAEGWVPEWRPPTCVRRGG